MQTILLLTGFTTVTILARWGQLKHKDWPVSRLRASTRDDWSV